MAMDFLASVSASEKRCDEDSGTVMWGHSRKRRQKRYDTRNWMMITAVPYLFV